MAVFLASTSPRRKEILSEILPRFQQVSPNTVEKEYPQLTPKEKAVRLSKDKCVAAVNHIREKGMVIIASDGVVDSIGEDVLMQFILDTNCLAPQEMADKILEKAKTVCGGVPIDDMTVVVGKIFKNT